MKQVIISTVVTLLFSSNIFSQDVRFGIRGGIALSKWDFNETQSSYSAKTKSGAEFGVYSEIRLSNHFSIQPEMLYSRRGTALSDGGAKVNYRTSNLMVPVLVKYRIPNSRLAVTAGPQVAFLLAANYKYLGVKTDLKEYLRSSVFSAVVGAEYQLPFGIHLAARYNFGLSGVQHEGEIPVKENVIGFSAGYEFSRLFSKPPNKKSKKNKR